MFIGQLWCNRDNFSINWCDGNFFSLLLISISRTNNNFISNFPPCSILDSNRSWISRSDNCESIPNIISNWTIELQTTCNCHHLISWSVGINHHIGTILLTMKDDISVINIWCIFTPDFYFTLYPNIVGLEKNVFGLIENEITSDLDILKDWSFTVKDKIPRRWDGDIFSFFWQNIIRPI